MISRNLFNRFVSQKARFHTRSTPLLKASVMEMPAMSPTMTEGGIVEWKVKAGDKFSSGDILVEVETDKATIDVEALDDGVMGKIVVSNGAKGIQVGSPIAVLAEEDDDLSTLDFDALTKTPAAKKEEPKKDELKKEEPKKQTTPPKTQAPTKSTESNSSIFKKADPNQTLYPSVIQLLHLNHISTEKAIAEIPATGPKGKLLKGDVLLYLQKINKDTYIKLHEYLQKGTVLDLSNIELKKAEPKKVETPIVLKPIVLTANVNLPPLVEGAYFEDVEEAISKKLQKLEREVYKLQALRSEYYDADFESLVSKRYSESLFKYEWSLDTIGGSKQNKKTDAFDELFSNATTARAENEFDGILSISVSINLGVSPKQDAVLKAEQFIKKVQNLS
ncbi:hypothetical protein QEN19_001595 [Hanseniaspora menglaensis]